MGWPARSPGRNKQEIDFCTPDSDGFGTFLHNRAMAANSAKPDVRGFYDEPSGSIGYVVSDPDTKRAVIIDPVLDYDEKAGRISTKTADGMLAQVAERNLKIDWIFDTHPHADHLSAAAYLKDRTGAPTAIGEKIVDVQAIWRDIYNEPELSDRRQAMGQVVRRRGDVFDRQLARARPADGGTYARFGDVPHRRCRIRQ